MKFTRDTTETAVQTIAGDIQKHLSAGESVLWFTSGGSAIATQVSIMNALSSALDETALSQLTILPIDERFGAFDHPDSNSTQLGMTGFNPYPALWVDVLSQNQAFEDTLAYYESVVSNSLEKAAYTIATLGIGADGHTAGILPESPATVDTRQLVIGYEWNDYTRMTVTSVVLSKLDTAYVLAYGDSKTEAVTRLRDKTESFGTLPAIALYDTNTTVYNDTVESEE